MTADGHIVEGFLAGGNVSDVTAADQLTTDVYGCYIPEDKGYDSDAFILAIRSAGTEPVIPPRKGRIQPRSYDHKLYKERNLVERLFQKLKHFRRVATRYEKLGRNYLGMLQLTASLIWLA